MTDKEKRHQVEDREPFTEAQKEFIASKSNHCCAWCGKKVYFKYGATIDHFVPLKKGGTNDPQNLVMMCEDCNKKKSSLIIPPDLGAKHLTEQYKEELDEWFDQYLDTYDYFSRGNYLACDVYEVQLYIEEVAQAFHRSKRHKNFFEKQCIACLLQRAYPDDEERVLQYYRKYLEKYKIPHSDEATLQNIQFWMRFGSLYFIERNGEIQLLMSITMNKNKFLSVNLFTYYSNSLAQTMCQGVIHHVLKTVAVEQNIPKLHIFLCMVKADSLMYKLIDPRDAIEVDNITGGVPYYTTNKHFRGDDPVKAQRNFYRKFKDIEGEVRTYLYENDINDMEWMVEEVIGRNYLCPDDCGEEEPEED